MGRALRRVIRCKKDRTIGLFSTCAEEGIVEDVACMIRYTPSGYSVGLEFVRPIFKSPLSCLTHWVTLAKMIQFQLDLFHQII